MRWFRLTAVAAVAVALALPASPASAAPADVRVALATAPNAQQVIVVTAPNWRATRGELRAYEKRANGTWRQVVAPTKAWLGYGGLVVGTQRRQGTGKTPVGTYAIPSAFGRLGDPGTKLRYRTFDRSDAWTYNPADPATYNVYQTANRSWRSYGKYAEHLWSYGSQYNYVAVMDFNLPKGPIRKGADGIRRTERPANTARGGGIFLHVSNGKSTAGCIAIAQPKMKRIMRWLDPAKNPVITVLPPG
jgi:L,D-peptidoglycan transpeptidase YkuD (ErfK/YbiS/YcfS/YnhG family)